MADPAISFSESECQAAAVNVMTKQEWNNEHNIWRNRPTLMPGVRTYARTLLSCLDLSDSECVCSLMFRFLFKQVKSLLICCVTQRKLCQLSRWITQYSSICLLSLDASLDFTFVSLPSSLFLPVFACLSLITVYPSVSVCLPVITVCLFHCLSSTSSSQYLLALLPLYWLAYTCTNY